MSISSDITRIKGAKDDLKTAINAKGGTLTTELIDEYPAAVDAIPTGTDTSSATAVASDILTGKTAYISDGTEATGTCDFNADTTDATAVENSILYGHTAYGSAGTKLTGTGAYWQYVKVLRQNFQSSNISGAVDLYCPQATSTYQTFASAASVTSVVLTLGTVLSFYNTFTGATNIQSITLNCSYNLTAASNFWAVFQNCTSLVTIDGDPINLTNADGIGSVFVFQNCSNLITVRFVANSIGSSFNIAFSPLLSTASLLSIANGLNAASAPKTLTMHATSKTNMDNISVDNVDGVAVLGSAMTLTAFVTGVKGWTIA